MEINIKAGQHILFKQNGQWEAGTISNGQANITEQGLFIPIISSAGPETREINDLFLDAKPVEDWMKQYNYLMTKEDYITYIQSDDFDHMTENGWVSDGEYYYYAISRYTENWLRKQPFDYIVRSEA